MAGQIGDAQVGTQPVATPQDASAQLSHEANQIGMNGIVGGAARIGLTTIDGIVHTPGGMFDTFENYVHHPMEAVKAVAESAAIGAALKVALPEAGPVGQIAGLAIGGLFLAQAAPGFIGAYKAGLDANTWSELNGAGKQWGDAAGSFAVNSGLGYLGFKAGAGLTGRVLAGESFDNFADWKQEKWNTATDKFKGLVGMDTSIPTASSVGLKPHYVVNGDRATLMDSIKSKPVKGEAQGKVDPNAPMDATIMLTSKATNLKMDRYIARMAQGKADILTDENGAFEKKFGASQESLDAVKKFAAGHNLEVTNYDLRSGQVKLHGKTGDFQRALGVQMENVKTEDGGIIKTQQGAVSLPAELTNHVRAVLGTDDRAVASSPSRTMYKIGDDGQLYDKEGKVVDLGGMEAPSEQADASGPPKAGVIGPESEEAGKPTHGGAKKTFHGYFATEVAKAQNFPMSSGGEGQNGAFISLGGGIDLNDYGKFYTDHSDVVPQPKPLNIVTIDGATNDFGDPNGADGENSLDAIQMQSVAPKANVSMILGQNTDQGFNNVFVRGIFPEQGEAQNSVVSSSWGAAESAQSKQAINSMSTTFKQGVIRGVQVFSASGDTGAKDGASDYEVDYPSSDPNVTGVGGLKMRLTPGDKVSSADAWNEGQDSSTGGGISKIFKLPAWQTAFNKVLNLDTGKPGRGVPDVSTDADPQTGFRVRVDGNEYVIGGTSDAAPLYSGMMLDINGELASAGLKQISPLNPWLYGHAGSPVFNDVTQGGNNGYKTAKGWDPVTGLGYIDGQQMLDAMKADHSANASRPVFTAPGSDRHHK